MPNFVAIVGFVKCPFVIPLRWINWIVHVCLLPYWSLCGICTDPSSARSPKSAPQSDGPTSSLTFSLEGNNEKNNESIHSKSPNKSRLCIVFGRVSSRAQRAWIREATVMEELHSALAVWNLAVSTIPEKGLVSLCDSKSCILCSVSECIHACKWQKMPSYALWMHACMQVRKSRQQQTTKKLEDTIPSSLLPHSQKAFLSHFHLVHSSG